MTTQGNATTTATQPIPAEAYLAQLSFGALVTQALANAARLGIADLLAEKPLKVSELAAATESDEQALYRMLRSLASVGVFEETAPKVFALTPYAEPLRSSVPNSMRNGAIFMGAEWHWRVWGNMSDSLKTGKSAWATVHGVEVFDYLQSNPEQYEVFNRAMTEMSASAAPAIVEAYDFSGVNKVVDIAGGHGYLLSQILGANEKASGVLFDLPEVIAGANKLLEEQGVSERVEKVTGNFFESVPAGGDCYIMKHIIHDWDDQRAIQILTNIAKVMDSQGKVLLVEIVIPEGNGPDLGKLMDLEMLVSPGGVERTQEEYRHLLATSGLRLTRIIPTKSAYSVIEAVKE